LHHSLNHHSASQIVSNQLQHPFVPDRLTEAVHQDVMVDAVKETLDTLPTSETFPLTFASYARIMPLKARFSRSSPSCGTEENRTLSWCSPTAASLTFPSPGPTLPRGPPNRGHGARRSPPRRTCYGCASVLTICCAGSKPVRAQTKTSQPWRTDMPPPQLELWSAEPHPAPPIYQHLTPEQRTLLISHLAGLILKIVQAPATGHSPSTESTHHERELKNQ
jgi:hypothetical protein